MVTGVTGMDGLVAPRLVDLEKEAEQGTVTTQLQLKEAPNVRDQALSLDYATRSVVQVIPACPFWL